MVPLKKQSKKEQKKYNAQKRRSWHGVKPVTRYIPSKKIYNRAACKRPMSEYYEEE